MENEVSKLVTKYFSQLIFANVFLYIDLFLLLKSRFFRNVVFCMLITKSVIQNIE